LNVRSDGNVGIGTTSPFAQLQVNGSSFGGNWQPLYTARHSSLWNRQCDGISFFTDGGATSSSYNANIKAFQDGLRAAYTALSFGTYGGAGVLDEHMRITSTGNILINKTSQTNTAYKLDINGSARANEVVVNTTGADFVFEPKYNLPKLPEIKSYIDANHHLPEIPS
jgi:hypothetical protein